MQPYPFQGTNTLQTDISCLWTLEESATTYNLAPIIPDSSLELVVNVGAPLYWQTATGQLHELPPTFLLGLHAQPLQLVGKGELVQLVSARLQPWALPMLSDHLLSSQSSPVQMLGQPWQTLRSLLQKRLAERGYAGAVAELQQFMVDYFQPEADVEAIRAAGQALYAADGQLRIRDLAQESYLSLSQFERRFKQVTGVTPKTLARLIRFEKARDTLFSNPHHNLADLAYDLGYTDQAHLGRDFKALAGFTPSQYMAQPDADFLQDN